MSAAACISQFTRKTIPHIACSTAYVVVPGVSFGIGAARVAYAVRNLIHHQKIRKQMSGILSFLETNEGQEVRYEGARGCLTITTDQKQAKLNEIKESEQYFEDQYDLALIAACMRDAAAASKRMTNILWKELARGLSEIFLPFVGPLLWTMGDIPGAKSANLFGSRTFLESWEWNRHLHPIARGLEHPKSYEG